MNNKCRLPGLATMHAMAMAGKLDSPVLSAKNSISADGELLLYGLIGDWWDGLDAKSIVMQLEQMDGDEITVRINSPGGNVVEGLAMYNRLKQSSKRVVVYVDGMAASMGCAIAMAGDEVFIPSNALMMMHKPSAVVGGNDDEIRDFADELTKIGEAYIQLHVDKTGKSFDEIKALIADGKNHYFRGQEAIDYGLADTLIDSVQMSAAACAQFKDLDIPKKFKHSLFVKTAAAAATTNEETDMVIKIKAKHGGWHYVPAVTAALTNTFGSIKDAVAELGKEIKVVNLADILEGKAECDVETLKAMAEHFGIVVVEPTQQPTAVQQAAAQALANGGADAVAEERRRIGSLRTLAAAHGIEDDMLNGWIDNGVTLAVAREKALDALATRDSQNAPVNFVRSGSSVGRDGLRGAIANAMLNRINPVANKLEENGRDFRGMSVMEMLVFAMQSEGQNVRGKSRSELVAMAMHTTTDFPLILQDVANKTLRAAYALAPITYKMVARQVSAVNFKPVYSVQIGGGSKLVKVNEKGEFTHGTVSESGENFKPETYGKIFDFSRQLIMNDDLSALGRFMDEIGFKAGRLENELAWGLIKTNGNLSDSIALFSTNAARKNQFSGTGITDTELSSGRKALRQMKGLDGEPLNINAKYLVVNSERETAGEKVLTTVQADSVSNVNIWGNRLEMIVETELDGVANNPWYMFADPMMAHILEYCYVDGQSEPYVEAKWGFDVDGVSLKMRHDFGVGVVDFRGAAKCTGA